MRRDVEAIVGRRLGGLVSEEKGRDIAAKKGGYSAGLGGGPRVTNLFGEVEYEQLGFRAAGV